MFVLKRLREFSKFLKLQENGLASRKAKPSFRLFLVPYLRQRALSSIELSFDYAPRALRGNHPLSFFYFGIVTLYDNTHQVGYPTPTLYPIVKEKSMVSFSKKHFCRFAQMASCLRFVQNDFHLTKKLHRMAEL